LKNVPASLPAGDLAPGDRRVLERDWSELSVRRVSGPADPDFALAYAELWREFGEKGGMEQRRVIEERLAWDPAAPQGGAALAYELLLFRRAGALAAVRDHSAVVRLDARGRPAPGPVVVHLSHALVLPHERGTGLAAWLRALPLQLARRVARATGAEDAAIVLAAEMEPSDPAAPGRLGRLRSYERAGFRMVDPAAAPYRQPDFRPAEVLARAVPEPIPFGLVLRRVGREDETSLPAGELAAVVEAIYAVYGRHVPATVLDPLRAEAAAWTARRPTFRLLPPTA
jgi:GNAT superfamily N-acetyltransferase